MVRPILSGQIEEELYNKVMEKIRNSDYNIRNKSHALELALGEWVKK